MALRQCGSATLHHAWIWVSHARRRCCCGNISEYVREVLPSRNNVSSSSRTVTHMLQRWTRHSAIHAFSVGYRRQRDDGCRCFDSVMRWRNHDSCASHGWMIVAPMYTHRRRFYCPCQDQRRQRSKTTTMIDANTSFYGRVSFDSSSPLSGGCRKVCGNFRSA